VALAAVLVLAVRRVLRTPTPDPRGLVFEPQPFPSPPRPVEHLRVPPGMEVEGGPELDGQLAGIAPWVEPVEGACPPSHPVKVKLSSGIYHRPGGLSYDRTRPDRCYLDAAAAEADGFRAARN
jgi:hypothetical protein